MADYNPIIRAALVLAIPALGAAVPAHGFELSQDEFHLQVDSTLSAGASWRASERDYRQVGLINAQAAQAAGDNPGGASHLHGSSAGDDSDLLWKKGSSFSELVKVVMDVELTYQDYGAFIRGKAFYDHRIVNGDGITDSPAYYWQNANGNNRLPNQSAGTSADILDAFIWGNWWLGDHPLNARLGKQVINWGEGLLFANGINSINPVDVNALLAPGSEVKDALVPLNSLYGSIGVNDALTIEGFVLLEWRETELPECGTFFAVTDLVGPGCYGGYVPSGLESSFPGSLAAQLPPAASVTLPRGADAEPGSSGQFGLAARYFAEAIETEFAVYYTNLHSNLPVISGHLPDVTQLGYATLSEARVGAITNPLNTLGPLGTSVLLPYGDYFVEYPEDIQMLGVSFSTTLDFGLRGGATSVSGEISMRKDQPFAREDGDALAGAVGLPSLACADAPLQYDCYSKFAPGDYNAGYVTTDYFQAELVFIQFFDQILGAARWTAVLDIAGSYLDMPSKNSVLLNSNYNATLNFHGLPNAPFTTPELPGLNVTPYPVFIDSVWQSTGILTVAPQDEYYPTSGAWGYKLRFAGEYNNVFAGINLHPNISFSHDVYGVTPTPIANFLQNRKALGLGLEAVYLNDYSVNFSYTDFYGAEPYNALADRDYYSVSAAISF